MGKTSLQQIRDKLAEVDKLDRREFIETFYKIRAKGGGLIALRANEGQQILHEVYMRQIREQGWVRIMILKARQLGMSTWVEALLYDHCAFNEYRRGLVIADDDDKAREVFTICRVIHDNNKNAPIHRANNDRELDFTPSNGSRLSVETCRNVDLGHGFTCTFLHGTEVSRWDGQRGNAEELMKGVHQTIHQTPGTVIILESTANGTGNWWHNEWERAQPDANGRSDSQYEPFFLPWYVESSSVRSLDDEHRYMLDYDLLEPEEQALVDVHKVTVEQIHWRKHAIRQLCGGKLEVFHEQYPTTAEEAFISTGRPVFPVDAVQLMLLRAKSGTAGMLERRVS